MLLSEKKHEGLEINKGRKKKGVLEVKQRYEITVQRDKKENNRKQGKRDK